jgi:hypothetical protein
MTTIKCPNCGAPLAASIDQIFDQAQDPTAKTRLLRGQFNLASCPTCGYRGTLATPIVYHDSAKELLLTYVPAELALPTLDQEQALGRLTQRVVSALPPEQRKGYLLRPQSFLTLQSLVERVLEADGITHQMLEQQRAKAQLAQELAQADPAQLPDLIRQKDPDIDAPVYQLVSAFAEAAAARNDASLRERATKARDLILEQTRFGKRLREQSEAFERAAQDLQKLGPMPTLDKLVDLFVSAPSLDRVAALTALTWQALDYTFFERLTARIDRAATSDQKRLTAIRDHALQQSQSYRHEAEAELGYSASVLRALLQAPDLPTAIEDHLADFTETFFVVLQTNLQAARQGNQPEAARQLEEIEKSVLLALNKALPPEVHLIRDLLEQEDDSKADALLQARGGEITDQLLRAMDLMLEDLQQRGESQASDRLRHLRETAQKQLALRKFTA